MGQVIFIVPHKIGTFLVDEPMSSSESESPCDPVSTELQLAGEDYDENTVFFRGVSPSELHTHVHSQSEPCFQILSLFELLMCKTVKQRGQRMFFTVATTVM